MHEIVSCLNIDTDFDVGDFLSLITTIPRIPNRSRSNPIPPLAPPIVIRVCYTRVTVTKVTEPLVVRWVP